jgi:uncharacterized membrane protein
LHPAWFVLGVFCLLLLFLALRLGVKAAVLDETATITFYATHYIIASTKEGHSGSESDCYATPHHLLWVRLEVICQPGAAAPLSLSDRALGAIDRHITRASWL